MLNMALKTHELLDSIDHNRFPSNAAKEYYDIIRELMSACMALDGIKAMGEGSHKDIIKYCERYLKESHISKVDKLRILRNRIMYDGYSVSKRFVKSNTIYYEMIIAELHLIIKSKLVSV